MDRDRSSPVAIVVATGRAFLVDMRNCLVDRDKLDLLRHADAIFLEEVLAAGLYDAIWPGVRCAYCRWGRWV